MADKAPGGLVRQQTEEILALESGFFSGIGGGDDAPSKGNLLVGAGGSGPRPLVKQSGSSGALGN
eukprot:CAMPEP_0117053908 /NCGR_PEP_ID=MMETSP0472-20121206/37319_1 /TAXON_ID=693140 ORGANISM="Tiarina fusus, Strain LIS" /NCGR_SAMPLE_ID=MMETSP0472 /ASSEMBLY_ACC=CAM_ASM_000603 /LENGTH=64 /DNA_ID=CAMNT_0004769209 /DNA_START=9 /DNA_END=203 /DNA_ORIENTATION=-